MANAPLQAETIVDNARVDAFICASVKLFIINMPTGLVYEPWDSRSYHDMRRYLVPAVYADSVWMR
jgi:hypothetical protein